MITENLLKKNLLKHLARFLKDVAQEIETFTLVDVVIKDKTTMSDEEFFANRKHPVEVENKDVIAEAHEEIKEKTTKPKREKKAKKVEPVQSEIENDFSEMENLDLEQVEEKSMSQQDLRHMLVAFAIKNGKTKAYEILAKYNAKKVDDLAPTDYSKIAQELTV